MPSSTTSRLFALAGLGVTTVLASCATTSADGGTDPGTTPDTETDTTAEYADGSYSADGDYISPAGPSKVTVEITLADDIVTSISVTPLSTDPTAKGFQTQFADGIAAIVEGQDIDTLSVSRVGGSSLTSGGFNDAIAKIKAEALAS
jgi:uncharacterized protein with FMN-binding domain